MTRRHLPVSDGPSSLGSDGARVTVYPADVHGRFVRARSIVFLVLIVVYAALPWIHVRGRPAVFLDIEHREFFLFGATFNAQDFWLVFFLLTGIGFSLLVLTAVAGRAWCGWACPQTVFLEGVFRRIERWIEGPREVRMRRHAGPWTFGRTARAVAKHGVYVVISLLLAHVFVSYFVSLPRLYAMVRADPGAHPEAFAWTAGIAVLLYVNFAWFREQLCLGVCPYGRLQAALTDADSLVVGYDVHRGEPRGKATEHGHGDCVDCGRCVVVCPTGIDIRRGLQLDCIGCTACIDACDTIMDRLDRRRGLIRYDSLNGLEGRPRRFVRPRLVVYAVLGFVGATVAMTAVRHRTDFEANLLRLRGAPYTEQNGEVRNAFELHLVNKRNTAATFEVSPALPSGVSVVAPLSVVSLGPLESMDAPLFFAMPRAAFHRDFAVPIRVHVRGERADADLVVSAPFLGPSSPAQ